MSSSIFSFESARTVRPRLPTALLAALGVVVALEATARLTPDSVFLPQGGWLGEYYFAEKKLEGRTEPPQIVLLGSSRLQHGVLDDLLAEGLGLPAGSCVNLGIRGGRPGDAKRYYDEHHALLSRSQLIILAVDEWQFSSGWMLDPRYRLYAPWGDRLAFVTETALPESTGESLSSRRARKKARLETLRSGLLLDAVFTTRIRMKYMRRALASWLSAGGSARPAVSPTEARRRLLEERGPATMTTSDLLREAHSFYRDYDVHPVLIDDLREFVRAAQADGVRVILCTLPTRDAYQHVVETEEAASYALFTKTLEDLATELDVPLSEWPRASDCGLDDADFLDYGHMAGHGAKRFTRFLARFIRDQRLLDR